MKLSYRLLLSVLVLGTGLTLIVCRTSHERSDSLFLIERNAPAKVPRYGLLELSFQHNGNYNNNFFDADLEAILKSPSGVEHRVKGFYYGRDLWNLRFRPDEEGLWTYSYKFTGLGRFQRQGTGNFLCIPSNEDGLVHRSSDNHFRWVFADGKPYFPIGLQDCIYMDGNSLKGIVIDGDISKPSGRRISPEEYFAIYGQAGFNLFRFSQKNCSYSLMDDLDHYRVPESIATDELLSSARQNGLRIVFGFFGFYAKQQNDIRALNILERATNDALGRRMEAINAPEDRDLIQKEERFVAYCVARWGVYADFWELLNERHASDQWTSAMADYIRSVDPDRKPISTSWERPNLTAIDIDAPHWYESENELSSDLRIEQLANKWKQWQKPVIVGEEGNTGMNWDPRSGVRMRIRAWTALFQEISLIFWNTSWSKAGMFGGRYTPGTGANIYLGPEERGYIRVLHDFSSRLGPGVRTAPVSILASPDLVRAYGLVSRHTVGIYLQHAGNHAARVENVEVSIDFSSIDERQLIGEWIDPATGTVVSRIKISPGVARLQVPPFQVDLALLVTPETPV